MGAMRGEREKAMATVLVMRGAGVTTEVQLKVGEQVMLTVKVRVTKVVAKMAVGEN